MQVFPLRDLSITRFDTIFRYANKSQLQVLSPISIAHLSRALPVYYKRVTTTMPQGYLCKVTHGKRQIHSLMRLNVMNYTVRDHCATHIKPNLYYQVKQCSGAYFVH